MAKAASREATADAFGSLGLRAPGPLSAAVPLAEAACAVGLIVAPVIGATAALLLAPNSGEDTRKYLSDTTKDSREAMEANGRELMDRGKDLYERGRKIAEDATDLFERGRKLVQG